MQKKLIALAVASLVSGAAFAQVAPNNVTLSGIIDMGYQYSWASTVAGTPAQHAFNDGGQDGSRLKLDGTEDLGNGLKVGFHTDFRFSVDTQSAVTTDNQNLFLTGGFGTVTAGSFGTALDDINGYSEAGGMGWGNGVGDMFKSSGALKNAVKYNSPVFGGFDFMAGISTNNQKAGEVEKFTDAVPADLAGTPVVLGSPATYNVRAYTARGSYVNGPVKAGLAVIKEKVQQTDASRTEWLLSGSYNFGPVILGAGYARSSLTDDAVGTDFGAFKKRTAYRINVGAPIGANDAVALSYLHAKQTYLLGAADQSAKGFGLSYTHNLSKRTNLYASYGQVNQDDGVAVTAVNGTYEKAFKVGLRHQF